MRLWTVTDDRRDAGADYNRAHNRIGTTGDCELERTRGSFE
jgi:hypothetical protein